MLACVVVVRVAMEREIQLAMHKFFHGHGAKPMSMKFWRVPPGSVQSVVKLSHLEM